MSIVSYGVRVGIRTNVAEALERVPELLPPGWRPARSPQVRRLYSLFLGEGVAPRPGVRPLNLLYGDTMRLVRSPEKEDLFTQLESDLRLYVAERAHRRVFVHAGVVGWEGRAIVIPGRSFTGKSSLVAALIRAGATYYSDEYAVLDEQGRVSPFPTKLSIRDGRDAASAPPSRVPPEEMNGRRGTTPLPLGLVAVTEYRLGARWRPQRLTPGRAVLALLRHTVPARRRPAFAMDTLRRAVSGALVLKGARGEAEGVVNALLEAVAQPL